jgi:hypothetical protein
MENTIIVDATNSGTFAGPLACQYAYTAELRRVVDGCFQAAQRSSNCYFVLEGATVRASQSTRSGAQNYLSALRTLLDCSAVSASRSTQ